MKISKDIKDIKLSYTDGDGKIVEFTVLFSSFTSGKMDKAQTLLGGYADKVTKEWNAGYYDIDYMCASIIEQYETLPTAFAEKEEFKPLLPLFEKYTKGEISKEDIAKKIKVVIKGEFTYSRKARNTVIQRELVKLMALESQLTKEQIELVKSDEFWCAQNAELIRDTGEFFRSKVLEHSNRD
jgi:hypothetical protein